MIALPPSTEDSTDALPFRAALRREKLAARMALDEASRAALATRIEAHLVSLLTPLPPQTVAFCSPVRREFDARPLAAVLIERGWRAAMPVIEAANAPMSFRTWTPATAMHVGAHGIPIPVEGKTTVPAIVLLPLVAFDRRGFRLGYGGGYFDRTLAALVPRPLAVGVGFELARTEDIRPQTHDMPLDAVVTEAGVMRYT